MVQERQILQHSPLPVFPRPAPPPIHPPKLQWRTGNESKEGRTPRQSPSRSTSDKAATPYFPLLVGRRTNLAVVAPPSGSPLCLPWPSSLYAKASAAAFCAALAAPARSSSSTLSSSRIEILAFRTARRASSVVDTCRLYRLSHLAN